MSEEQYKEILRDGPNAQAYNKLGCLKQFTGELSKALEYHKKAVQAEPENFELQANLARVLIETRDTHAGIDMLRKAVEKMPKLDTVSGMVLHDLVKKGQAFLSKDKVEECDIKNGDMLVLERKHGTAVTI